MSARSIDRSESIFVENKQNEFPVDIDVIGKAVAFVLDKEGAAAGEVTVTFVDSAEMAGMNKQYRDMDGPTDVLSFCMAETIDGEPDVASADSEDILGDIVVCPGAAAENAAELGHSLDREILEITIHGVLHLLGYGHDSPEDENTMIARQEELAGMFDEA